MYYSKAAMCGRLRKLFTTLRNGKMAILQRTNMNCISEHQRASDEINSEERLNSKAEQAIIRLKRYLMA